MDLYIQVGVLLIMATMFSLVAYYYADSMDRGTNIHDKLNTPTVNYYMDSSITTPTFLVDYRNFTQWAINAKSQRKVYLVYPTSIVPDTVLHGAYLHKITTKINNQDLADRKFEVHPQVPSNAPNSYLIDNQNPKTLDFLTLYSQNAKLLGKNKMVTVHTFIDQLSSETIYVCYIK